MKYLLFIFFAIGTFVNATPGFLAPRQEECPPGAKVCGIKCIPDSYTCCRDSGGGGCPPGSRCNVGSNGVGGCCPIGETCTGAAPLPSKIDEDELTPTADPTTAIDDPITTIDEGPPTKTTDPETSEEKPSDERKPSDAGKSSDDSNSGASDRLDSTVSYLLLGAMVLLI